MILSSRAVQHTLLLLAAFSSLSACSLVSPDANNSYPKTEEDRRKERLGKITGEEGLVVGGASDKKDDSGKNPLGVNSFLWRATLDTLSFLPITTADPFGGTVLTDWYEDPAVPGERYKVNVLILDRQLRADSLKISTFRQKKEKNSQWVDAPTDAKLGRKLEDTVLTRARELRVKQLGY
jgi:hypothetical protein